MTVESGDRCRNLLPVTTYKKLCKPFVQKGVISVKLCSEIDIEKYAATKNKQSSQMQPSLYLVHIFNTSYTYRN